MMSFVLNTMDFASRMRNLAFKLMRFVLTVMKICNDVYYRKGRRGRPAWPGLKSIGSSNKLNENSHFVPKDCAVPLFYIQIHHLNAKFIPHKLHIWVRTASTRGRAAAGRTLWSAARGTSAPSPAAPTDPSDIQSKTISLPGAIPHDLNTFNGK